MLPRNDQGRPWLMRREIRMWAMLGSGLGLALFATTTASSCGAVYGIFGYPPEAGRETPPPGIEERARDVRAKAAPVKARSTRGHAESGIWEMTHDRVTVLVFYRGSW